MDDATLTRLRLKPDELRVNLVLVLLTRQYGKWMARSHVILERLMPEHVLLSHGVDMSIDQLLNPSADTCFVPLGRWDQYLDEQARLEPA